MRLPQSPPSLNDLLEDPRGPERLIEILAAGIGPSPTGKYLPWDMLRHRDPPNGLSAEDWWLGVVMARESMLRPIPLIDKHGAAFRCAMPDLVLELVHEIDRDASGKIEISEQILNPDTRDRYIVSSLIEEAANSSILEGASTTVPRAKEMIRTNRKPLNRGEQMVLNNFFAMRRILELQNEDLSPEIILELHRIVTEHTLGDPAKAGRLRQPEDATDFVEVVDRTDGTVLHTPPDASELPDRLDKMCEFANDTANAPFVHPVLRAVILHFWLAYDHPFVDGNGRAARSLFYWSMLRQGYWLASFLSISRILIAAPAKYARSFLYTETDRNDLTYFIVYQLGVVRRAIEDLKVFLDRKAKEIRDVEALLSPSIGLNHRQIALLSHAIRHPGARYTIDSHRTSHDVVYQTARTDLHDLADRGLLVRRKAGRRYSFSPSRDLSRRLKD